MNCPRCDRRCEPGSPTCEHCGCALEATLDSATNALAARAARGAKKRRPARFEPGERIDGRYRIVGLVGRGGMGEVYRADDLKLGQTVALKFLPSDLEGDPDRVERLLHEVRLARQVAHPNVCRVFDVGEVDGRHFLSMEFVDGEDLASLLRRIGHLSPEKAAQVGRQICAGLAVAHEQGILHRDLKPANVMLDGRGRAKITDFGLAAIGSEIEGAELHAGTPAYMAPEQHEGRGVTERSDIYALGLVLYELFTGERLLDDDSLREAFRAGSAPTPREARSWKEPLDPAVESVIQRCLERDPARRPRTALAVAAALPGGDALAAALAAGDTPSPDMVAEAGSTEGLAPRRAVTWLVVLLAGLVAQAWISDASRNQPLARAAKPPPVLADRAGEILEGLGLREDAHASVGWFYWDPAWASEFGHSGPTPLRYGWREVPDGGLPNMRWTSRWHDPSPDLVGSRRLVLDPSGRLLYLDAKIDTASGEAVDTASGEAVDTPTDEAVDTPTDEAVETATNDAVDTPTDGAVETPTDGAVDTASDGAAGFDWSDALRLFELDDLPLADAEPRLEPRGLVDERVAWAGAWPEAPDVSVHVEAGTRGGQLVWMDTEFGGVLSGSVMQPRAVRRGLSPVSAMIFFVLPALAAGLAWRNHRLRRTDGRGAALAFAIVFVGHVAVLFASGQGLRLSSRMLSYLREGLAVALFTSTATWLYYLAVEPLVRRWWPSVLIGWSRLATKRRLDPLVGREVLVGLTLGALLACVRTGNPIVAALLSTKPLSERPLHRLLDGGTLEVMASGIHEFSDGLLYGMLFLFVAAVSRWLVGRAWPLVAGPLAFGVSLALETGAMENVVGMATSAIGVATALFVLSRWGLLSGFACMGCYLVLTVTGTTLDPGLWTFGARLTLLAALAAAGLLACFHSVGRAGFFPATGAESLHPSASRASR